MYYAIYRVMLESGARLSHTLLMLENWRPGESRDTGDKHHLDG